MKAALGKMQAERLLNLYKNEDFGRQDESPDANFYATDRMLSHLDATALASVEKIIKDLVVEDEPVILDLMASWDSHLPQGLKPGRVIGLGMNPHELAANAALDEHLIQDLNQNPQLPFGDNSFDVVLNVVSVDYLIDPLAVFTEVGRVLKPGGLFLVIFSNRWFEPKVTNIWRRSSEGERFSLVSDWLGITGLFASATSLVSKGLPRPADDKYTDPGLPSDPIYALWAEKTGGDPSREARPYPRIIDRDQGWGEQAAPDLAQVAETLRCPHCGEKFKKWQVPQTPFTQWENEFMYVCFNDLCPYFLRGFEAMGRQGNVGSSYRQMFNPVSGTLGPILVQSPTMLKDGIMD